MAYLFSMVALQDQMLTPLAPVSLHDWPGLTHLCLSLSFPPEIVVWNSGTFDDNFGINIYLTKHLRESCY